LQNYKFFLGEALMHITGPDGKIQFRITHDACSIYENEDENISDELETYFQGEEGESWKEIVQVAADSWDWDDEGVINFDAESILFECSRDFKKMEFLSSKNDWQLVPEEIENWYFEAEEKSMNNG